MSSPEVWDDALARVQAVATAQAVHLTEVGMQDTTDQTSLFLAIETRADTADRVEMTGQVWEELGQVWVHVMVPSGSTSRPAMVLRKVVADAFRFADALPDGLSYLGCSFAPPDAGAVPGNWSRLSLAVDYRYQDISADLAPAPSPTFATVANLIMAGDLLPGLPTADPGVSGRVWNDGGILAVSSGPVG